MGGTGEDGEAGAGQIALAVFTSEGCGLCRVLKPQIDAAFPLYEEWGVFMGEERPEPTTQPAFLLTATGDALDRKVAALAAMASQTADAIAGLGEATYEALVADEAFVEAAR